MTIQFSDMACTADSAHSGVEVSRDIDGNFIFAFPSGFTKHDEEMFLKQFYEAVKNPIFLATIPVTGCVNDNLVNIQWRSVII